MQRRDFLKNSAVFSALAAMGIPASAVAAADSPAHAARGGSEIGYAWAINANGSKGTLNLGGQDAQGNLLTSTFDKDPLIGFYSFTAKKLTFLRLIGGGRDTSSVQFFVGYLMGDGKAMAGTLDAFQGTGATGDRSTFGWYATRP